MIVKGTTRTGFVFFVDSACLEDAEFLETFADVQSGKDGLKAFELIRKSLGDDQKAKLYDHVRTEDGRVPVTALTDEISDIFETLGRETATKNLSPLP